MLLFWRSVNSCSYSNAYFIYLSVFSDNSTIVKSVELIDIEDEEIGLLKQLQMLDERRAKLLHRLSELRELRTTVGIFVIAPTGTGE